MIPHTMDHEVKVFIDRNIEINAVTHRTVLAPQVIKWGPTRQTIKVAQRASSPPRSDERFRRDQLPFLATLCNLARQGKLVFFRSFEIKMEMLRQKGHCEGYLGINLLRGVQIKSVPCPVQRSIVIAPNGGMGVTKKEQIKFFRSIRDARFLQIRNAVGDAHVDDAFHLWTAEEARLDVFLTMDQRFWRVVNQRKIIVNSPVRVLTPKELCLNLNAQATNIEKLAAAINPFS